MLLTRWKQAAAPYRALATESRTFLARDAHSVIVEAERQLLNRVDGVDLKWEETLERELREMRRLLAEEPDNRSAIKSAMDQLRKVCC
jgi:hypothetical protein